MKQDIHLDAEEQDLEDNLEKCFDLSQEDLFKILLEEIAKAHLKNILKTLFPGRKAKKLLLGGHGLV